MIKKILSTLLVSSALFLYSPSTSSFADRPTLAIGYTAAYGGYAASGTETEGGTASATGPQDPQEQELA